MNYRSVSLTSVCCKTMERVVAADLMQYLESNGLLSDRQFGFCKCRSTEEQMLLVYSEIAAMVNSSRIVDMVLLDFSKTFDVVSHVVLLEKLRELGVCAMLLRWVEGFLSNRSMRVSVGGVSSGLCRVSNGVPQGLVLGPILFLVAIC